MTMKLIESFREIWDQSRKPIFFTGAGISTESGIPDFRGPSGFWKTNTPIYFDEFISSESARRDSWIKNIALRKKLKEVAPNLGHLSLKSLMQIKKESYLITQNVDNLHQDSGIHDSIIIELHGNSTYALCLSCSKNYSLEEIHKKLIDEEIILDCIKCGGLLKTATISFGQAMPEEKMQLAQRKVIDCDLFISIGSSLTVYPAAGLPKLAKDTGAKLININAEETELDYLFDLVINERIGNFLADINKSI
jgi:NAD-dependent deacetylase